MTYPVFATVDDLPLEVDQAGESLLGFASLLVASATRRATFRRDTAGHPVSTAIADILRDATVAQVTFWVRNGMDPTQIDTTTRVVAHKGLDGATITYGDAQRVAADLARARDGLCNEARLILANAHLTSGHPRVVG